MRKVSPDRSDADLVAACREGDPAAWQALVDRYRRLVFGIPLALGLQHADAEEVFQATFTELLRSLSALRDGSLVGAWLATTAKRTALRLRRAERRRASCEEPIAERTVAVSATSTEEVVDRLREGDRVLRAVESLGEPCRTLLLGLFSDPPRSYKEIAWELGLAVGSLGAIRGRCLARLRRRLQQSRTAPTIFKGAKEDRR